MPAEKHPAARTAHQLLVDRLVRVRRAIKRVRQSGGNDPERVHKLRVAGRVARAALKTLGQHLPAGTRDRLKRDIRSLHRACGEVRDWDVLIVSMWAAVAALPPESESLPAVAGLIGWSAAHRSRATERLAETLKDRHRKWARVVARIESHAPRDGTGSVEDLVLQRLSPLIHSYHQTATGDNEDDARLHRVRIDGKRLRYTLDLLAGGSEPARYAALRAELKAAQEILGRFQDAVVAGKRLAEFTEQIRPGRPDVWESVGPGVEQLVERFTTARLAERLRFREWRDRWAAAGCPCPECSTQRS